MGAAIAWLQSALGDKKAFVLLLQLGSTFYAAHLFQFPAPVPRAPPSFHAAALCSGCQQGLSHPHHRQTLFRCCHFSLEASQRIRNVILALRCTISQILKSFGWTLPLFRPIKARRGHTGRPCFATVCLTFFFFSPHPPYIMALIHVWNQGGMCELMNFLSFVSAFFPPSSLLLVLGGLW